MTLIEGDTGVIVIDPLISVETAQAGLELYRKHRGPKPVVAVIYTHSHVDHWGGVKGVTTVDDVKAGKVPILAPAGFLEHATSENVFAGTAMARRAVYMYGALLPKGEKGQVDAGLGKTTSLGLTTLIPPTDTITATGEKRVIDGVEIVFQMAPDTEAPAEMLFYFPQFRALCAAEDMTHTLHNLYTIRGAQVRDAKAWWKAVNQARDLFGDKTDVVFASHHWPKWGNDKVDAFLRNQRDLYKYIHDQSLRLMNHGYTMTEVAEMMVLPDSLGKEWYNRGFYGTLNHDAKAVYQRYLGWYDGNPAHLHPLQPEDAAKKYVAYMGGSEAVIAKAKADYDNGEYRWVAEVMSHVVFAEPDNVAARNLEADALEQLGYQAESGPWRNAYLVGAFELRNGLPPASAVKTTNADVVSALTTELYFDYMGIRLNGPKAEGKTAVINWDFTDTGEKYAMNLENCALTYSGGKQAPNADVTLTLARTTLDAITVGQLTFGQAIAEGKLKIDGDAAKLNEMLALMDNFDPMFNIVTP
jgi:alkyl sulfatase BDS1-like metallo-beta-lactamase superfamily hydrolase